MTLTGQKKQEIMTRMLAGCEPQLTEDEALDAIDRAEVMGWLDLTTNIWCWLAYLDGYACYMTNGDPEWYEALDLDDAISQIVNLTYDERVH